MAVVVDEAKDTFDRLCLALIHAFPTWRALDLLVAQELGEGLEYFVRRDALRIAVPDLVRSAEVDGRLGRLLDGAVRLAVPEGETTTTVQAALVEVIAQFRAAGGVISGATKSRPATVAPVAPTARTRAFIGRDAEVEAALGGVLAPGGRVVVTGRAGEGKSFLLREVERRGADGIGRVLRIELDPLEPVVVDALREMLAAQLDLRNLPERQLAAALAAANALVVIENVDARETADVVVELAARLPDVRFLVSARHPRWDAAGGAWQSVPLPSFTIDDAHALIAQESGFVLAADDEARLFEELGGLPLALHLAAGYLRRGWTVGEFLDLLAERWLAVPSSSATDPQVHERERGNMHVLFEVSYALLLEHGQRDGADWSAPFAAICTAPLAGLGDALAAAIVALDGDVTHRFLDELADLSLIDLDVEETTRRRRWKVHPLIARYGRAVDRLPIDLRIGAWIVAQVDRRATDLRARGIEELRRERAAVLEWFRVGTATEVATAASESAYVAESEGPLLGWLGALRRVEIDVAPTGIVFARGRLALVVGELEEADACAARLIALADGDLPLRMRAEVERGRVAFRRSKLPGARRWWTRARETALRMEDSRAVEDVDAQLDDLLSAEGRYDEAIRRRQPRVDQAMAPAYEANTDDVTEVAAYARDVAATGDADKALELLEAWCVPKYHALGETQLEADVWQQIAYLLANPVEGQPSAEALARAEQILRTHALAAHDHAESPVEHARALGHLAGVMMLRDEHEEALRLIGDAEKVLRFREPHSFAMTRTTRLNVLQRMGRDRDLIDLADDVLASVREAEDPANEERLLAMVVAACARVGDCEAQVKYEHELADVRSRESTPDTCP